jgi:two-component system nitrate/nitrite response regulator NarL
VASFDLALLIPQRLLREALAQQLAAKGHRVLRCTGDRDELFAALETQRPQVTLLDVDPWNTGPDAGLDALKALRAWYPDIRVLALAHLPSPELVEDIHRARAHGLLDKDETGLALLFQALETVHEGGRFFPVATLAAMTPVPSEDAGVRSGVLTEREIEVLRYIAAGADNLQIAKELHVSERTVRAHVSALYRKLAAQNRVALALQAARMGIKVA